MTTSSAPPEDRRTLAHEFPAFLARTTFTLVLLTACYYLVPLDSPFQDAASGARWVGCLLAFGGFALVLRAQLRSARTERSLRSTAEAVLAALYLLILVFALTYHQLALRAPEQFEGIHNQTDALYFTVSIISTVGFGDVTATGTAARAVVTVQMLLDLVVLGLGIQVILGAVKRGKATDDTDSEIGA